MNKVVTHKSAKLSSGQQKDFLPLIYRLVCMILLSLGSCKWSDHQTEKTSGQQLPTPVQTLAFGSCNRVELDQSYWSVIQAQKPDLWLWLGDIIYADTEDMPAMAAMYQRLKDEPYYQRFRETVPVLGVWDDHDYGVNDGDKRYPRKTESKQLLLNFLDVDSSAAVRKRAGVYQSYDLPLISKGHLKLILLDVRSFRDTLQDHPEGPERYLVNEQGDILGEEQWVWLEQILDTSTAAINLIGGGIQFMQEEQYYEKWANFPAALKRFYELIIQMGKPVILLSGDRHIGEIAKRELPGQNDPLYEITSSGLTHAYLKANEKNAWRIGPLVAEKNFAVLKFRWHDERLVVEASLLDPDEGVVHFAHTWSYPDTINTK